LGGFGGGIPPDRSIDDVRSSYRLLLAPPASSSSSSSSSGNDLSQQWRKNLKNLKNLNKKKKRNAAWI
jgi:hypothetical protein